MSFQEIDMSEANLARIAERLDNAVEGRKKSRSIASLVERLRTKIEAHRARGLTWRAIAFAILEDETKQAAIRSAYERLPPKSPHNASQASQNETPCAPVTRATTDETQAHGLQVKTRLFSSGPITDTYSSDGTE